MLDASDHNPSLLGQGSSELSRIQIISEDDYAEYLRAKTTLSQFAARFQAARDAIAQARQALEQLRQAAAKGDPAATAQAAQAAKEAHQQAAALLDKIARDFPAFELEKRLQELAEQQADDLRENLAPLENFNPNAPKDEQDEALARMLDRLGRRQAQAEPLAQDLDQVRQAATLLEMAARFRQIHEAQKSLAKRFATIVEELRLGEDRNRRLLPSLAETQHKNRQALDDFKAELRRRAEALPNDNPDLTPLVDSALKFLTELDHAAPESLMDAAAAHGQAGQANDAFANAELARALLERLMSATRTLPASLQRPGPRIRDSAPRRQRHPPTTPRRPARPKPRPGQWRATRRPGPRPRRLRPRRQSRRRLLRWTCPSSAPSASNSSRSPAAPAPAAATTARPARSRRCPPAPNPAPSNLTTTRHGQAATPTPECHPRSLPRCGPEVSNTVTIQISSRTCRTGLTHPMKTILVLLALTLPLTAKEGAVECGNLIYAGTRTSKCFSDEFLTTVQQKTSIATERRFKAVKLADEELFRSPLSS